MKIGEVSHIKFQHLCWKLYGIYEKVYLKPYKLIKLAWKHIVQIFYIDF